MKKLIILFIAALLSTGAYAADTASGSPPLTKKEQRRTLRGYKGFVELGAGITLHDYDFWFSLDDDRPKGFGMDLLTRPAYHAWLPIQQFYISRRRSWPQWMYGKKRDDAYVCQYPY